MLTRLFNWLFGKKAASTIGGIAMGAATGAGAVAAAGNITTADLITGAAVGASAALTGAVGRGHGEN